MSEPSGTTPDAWAESYAIWSTALDLPPTHERVARLVVREKISQAIENCELKINPIRSGVGRER